ncbi:hypothetical protein [Tritonibacter scottomollicae]|uniref:HEAT repeat protein n=1 Tax=Tritonibacter scottomollicae TaxID=483013 RepID=A0A2T1A1G2_TRISK|nr:hypothetical protein [Tritonibacter scottomollicae]PRZ42374.1 hypothetical protein CLV89_1342 [Tritonibacter scottomollicae]
MFKALLDKIAGRERSRQKAGTSKDFARILEQGTRILRSTSAPNALNKIEDRVRSELRLHSRCYPEKEDTLNAAREEIRTVRELPDLAQVFIFHGDGRVREEAVRNLEGPLLTPASVYGLFWRLNDWVPQVRSLADEALKRVMPTTTAPIVVPALTAILPHLNSWGRCSGEGRSAVREIMGRPDIAAHLVEDMKTTIQPRLGQILRELSRNPEIDQHIESLFVAALLPHIRAMALEMLLSGQARWPTGRSRRVWIDRSMDKYRNENVYDHRDISIQASKIDLIAVGALDRSAMVRRRAADGLISLRNDPVLRDDLDAIAARLQDDPNIGVRNRIEFYGRNQPAR